ncbi:MAG: ATP-binding cassette domain-containing protein [Candidatus Acidiferrum sp.]
MIRVENLVKKFGDFAAVDNISFEVPKGEIFAFLGPNGAGKTTIKVLTTLLKATSGTVELDGMNPATHENEVRKRFGISTVTNSLGTRGQFALGRSIHEYKAGN